MSESKKYTLELSQEDGTIISIALVNLGFSAEGSVSEETLIKVAELAHIVLDAVGVPAAKMPPLPKTNASAFVS